MTSSVPGCRSLPRSSVHVPSETPNLRRIGLSCLFENVQTRPVDSAWGRGPNSWSMVCALPFSGLDVSRRASRWCRRFRCRRDPARFRAHASAARTARVPPETCSACVPGTVVAAPRARAGVELPLPVASGLWAREDPSPVARLRRQAAPACRLGPTPVRRGRTAARPRRGLLSERGEHVCRRPEPQRHRRNARDIGPPCDLDRDVRRHPRLQLELGVRDVDDRRVRDDVLNDRGLQPEPVRPSRRNRRWGRRRPGSGRPVPDESARRPPRRCSR